MSAVKYCLITCTCAGQHIPARKCNILFQESYADWDEEAIIETHTEVFGQRYIKNIFREFFFWWIVDMLGKNVFSVSLNAETHSWYVRHSIWQKKYSNITAELEFGVLIAVHHFQQTLDQSIFVNNIGNSVQFMYTVPSHNKHRLLALYTKINTCKEVSRLCWKFLSSQASISSSTLVSVEKKTQQDENSCKTRQDRRPAVTGWIWRTVKRHRQEELVRMYIPLEETKNTIDRTN